MVTKALEELWQDIEDYYSGKGNPQQRHSLETFIRNDGLIYIDVFKKGPVSAEEIRKTELESNHRHKSKKMGQGVFERHVKGTLANLKEFKYDEKTKKYRIQRFERKENHRTLFFFPLAKELLKDLCKDYNWSIINRKCRWITGPDYIYFDTFSLWYNRGPGSPMLVMSFSPSRTHFPFSYFLHRELRKNLKEIEKINSKAPFFPDYFGMPTNPPKNDVASWLIKFSKIALAKTEGMDLSQEDIREILFSDETIKLERAPIVKYEIDLKNRRFKITDKAPFFPNFLD